MDRITDLRTVLGQPLSRQAIGQVAASVAEYPSDIPQLVGLINDSDDRVSWRAAWACEKLLSSSLEEHLPYRHEFTQKLFGCRHDGTRRLLLSLLYRMPRPETFPGELYNYCLEQMLSPREKPAVQALSMKLAFELGKEEPELLSELKLYLENCSTQFYSPAFLSARRNVLRHIEYQQKNKVSKKCCFQKN